MTKAFVNVNLWGFMGCRSCGIVRKVLSINYKDSTNPVVMRTDAQWGEIRDDWSRMRLVYVYELDDGFIGTWDLH